MRTKATPSPVNRRPARRPPPVAQYRGSGVAERTSALNPGIGDQAPRWSPSSQDSGPSRIDAGRDQGRATSAKTLAPRMTRPGWEFGSIPPFPTDRTERQLTSSPAAAVRTGAARLGIAAADDPSELEADRIANQVMGLPGPGRSRAVASRPQSAGTSPRPARTAPGIVDDVLATPGQPLDDTAQAFFEPRLGHDFSRVRVHRDSRAAASADAVDARAYAVGNSIVFGDGQFRLDDPRGRRLVAHELAHVAQQDRGTAAGNSDRLQRQSSDDENQLPDNYPDWQHGAPTKPVPPDPHVHEIPSRPTPPDQGPYRNPGTPSQPQPSSGVSWGKVLTVLTVLGLSIALVPTVLAALADPEPATKLALAGLTAVEISALAAALGFSSSPSPSSA